MGWIILTANLLPVIATNKQIGDRTGKLWWEMSLLYNLESYGKGHLDGLSEESLKGTSYL